MREEAHVWFGIDHGKTDDERFAFINEQQRKTIERMQQRMPDVDKTPHVEYEGGKRKAQLKRERNKWGRR